MKRSGGTPAEMENGEDKCKASGSSSTALTPRTADGQTPAPPKALQVASTQIKAPNEYCPYAGLIIKGLKLYRTETGCMCMQGIQDQLDSLQLDQQGNEPKKSYAFWETQPVAQFNERASNNASTEVSR